MALLGNYSVLCKNAVRRIGGDATGLSGNRSNWQTNGAMRNHQLVDMSNTALVFYGKPDGYYPPYTWMLPQKSGALSVNFSGINGNTVITNSNLAAGYYVDSDITTVGNIADANINALGIIAAVLAVSGAISDAAISGTSELFADLTSTAAISNALINASVSITADLTGISNFVSDIAGALYATAALSGDGDITNAGISLAAFMYSDLTSNASITDADLNAIWNMLAAISGTTSEDIDINGLGHITTNLTGLSSVAGTSIAKAYISSDISSFSELSPEALSLAVWNQLQSQFTTPGTMGYALVQALGAGGALTSDQATQLAEVWKIMGLDPANPMSVSSTERTVDEIAQTFTGTDTVVVTRT